MEQLADISAFENLNNSSVCGVWNDWKSDIAGGARQLGSGLWGGALAGAKKVDDLTARARRLGQRISRGVGAGIKAFREEPNNPDNDTRMWRDLREEYKRRSEECKRRSTKNQRTTKRIHNGIVGQYLSDALGAPQRFAEGMRQGVRGGISGFMDGMNSARYIQNYNRGRQLIEEGVRLLIKECDVFPRRVHRFVAEAISRYK